MAQCESPYPTTGVGLPQQDRDRLTEPYVTHKPKGTGLGLAIVKKIMEDHGGSVTLDDRPGHSFRRGRHADPAGQIRERCRWRMKS
ncbi:MAG: ATP-binding protein [Rhodospirillales bacterium]